MKRILTVLLMLTVFVGLFSVASLASEQGETKETAPISQIHEGEKKTDGKQETVLPADYPLEADDVNGETAKERVRATIEDNSGLIGFEDSQIKTATTAHETEGDANLQSVITALVANTADATAKNNLTAVTSDKLHSYVQVSVLSATVAEFVENGTPTAMVKSIAFSVKPMTAVEVTTSKGTATIRAEIPNEAISDPITFRLPVDSGVPEHAMVKVYHQADASAEKMLFGSYSVQDEDGHHFIELSAKEFSIFSYELAEQTVDEIGKEISMTSSLVMGDRVRLNVRLKTIASGTSLTDYTFKYSFAGGAATERSLGDYTLSTPISVAEYAPSQYTQLTSVEVFYQGASVFQRNLSVEKYCVDVWEGKIAAESDLKQVCANLLEYGYYAQGDTGVRPTDVYRSQTAPGTEIPAFSSQPTAGSLDGVTEITASLVPEDSTVFCYDIALKNTSETIDKYAVSVSLDGQSYRTVSVGSPVTLDIVKLTASGRRIAAPCTITLTATGTAGHYQVTVSDIPFAFLNQPFYLKVEQGGAAKTACASPLSYAYGHQNETNGTWMKALYQLQQSLKQYYSILD